MSKEIDRSLQELILENTDEIMGALEEALNPVFNVNTPLKYKENFDRYAMLDRKLLPKQAENVAAIEEFYKTSKSCVAVLDTGYGKTSVACGLMSNPDFKNIYYVVPPHLILKTEREIHKVLGDSFQYRIIHVKSHLDILSLTKFKYRVKKWKKEHSELVEKLKTSKSKDEVLQIAESIKEKENAINKYDKYIFDDEIKTIYIAPKTLNSLSYQTKPIYNIKKKLVKEEIKNGNDVVTVKKWKYDYTCCCCNSSILKSTDVLDDEGNELEPDTKKADKVKKCTKCDTPLRQPTNHRISPAEFLGRYGIKEIIDISIFDELHEEKAKDTGRGKALGVLVPKSKKVLGKTGTLLGGYASHAFYTFFRLFPNIFKNEMGYEWGDVNKFIQEFGGSEFQTQVLNYNPTTFHITEYGRKFGQKERADMSPRLLDAILPMCVFGKLEEIKFPDKEASLPPYTEYSHIVELEDELQESYNNYLKELTPAASYALKEFDDRKGWAKLNIDALLIPDIPFTKTSVTIQGADGIEEISYIPNVTREDIPLTNKEKKLLEIVKANKAKNRKVLVYHDFVNSGLREDLIEILQKNGFNAEGLNSSIPAKKREAFINSLDVDVLITNPELVKTGLDLLEYPTIVFYEQMYGSYNIFTMRQASKRAWRIGQREDCEVHSIAYAGTHQKTCLELIGSKINVSQTTEGRLSTGSDIASEAADENMQVAMARAILSNEKILNETSSNSKTLDLNDREWTLMETYYLDTLKDAEEHSEKYEKYKSVFIEEKKKYKLDTTKLINSVLSDLSKQDVFVDIPAEDLTIVEDTKDIKKEKVVCDKVLEEYRVFIPVGKKSKKAKGKTVAMKEDDFNEYLSANKSVQLTLF